MAKGGSFEREISKILSLWWTDEIRDDIFYRSQSSGARFTQRRKSGKDTAYQCGDITCSDPSGKDFIDFFSIECKTGYGSKTKTGIVRWDVLDFIDSTQKETVLMKMWKQCAGDASVENKEPLLIFRRNLRKPCIVFRNSFRNTLIRYFNVPQNTIKVGILNIMPLADFLTWIPDIRPLIDEEGRKNRGA